MRTACRCFSHLLPLLTFLALDCITLQDAPAQSIQFRDVTNETGITPNDPEGYGHGSSFGDFNGDGRPDIYIISYATANFLFRNDGGHFTDIAASAGVQYPSASDRGMAAADYDNDGDLDIYIAAGYTGNVLYHNNGDNTFTDVTDEAGVNLTGQGQGAAWGDYNGDGLLDLFVAQTDGYNVLFRQESDHHFTDVNDAADIGNYSFSLQPVFFDVDNDGDVDLFVARRENQANLLYINNGNGTFRERAAAWGIDSPAPHSQGAAVGDYDRDGDLDVYVCDYDGYNLLYRNQGHYFEEVASWAGVEAGYSGNRGAVFADFNDDGWLDLYVTRRNENKMYQNNGDGTFRNVSGSSGANDWNDGYSPSIADYDNDGDLDIFFTNTGQNSVLLQNQGPFNNWLQIKLIGTTSNSGGVGARLTGWLNGQRQTQTIVAGQAYLCTGSDLTAHFALGSSTHLDSLVIHWPSGIRDRFPNLSANQKLTLIEGTGGGPDTTAPIITGVAADNLTSTTATISWRTDELADSQVEYGLTANYGSTTLLDSNRVNTHAVSLAGLIKNTTYHYRVRSRDAAGNLAVSNDFTFTTLSTDVTPPVILSVFAGNFTSSSATINWTTDEASDSQVEYGLTTSYGNSTALESALVTSHTVSLSGLQASTTYHYRVKSKDAAGNLAVGDDFTFSTLAMSPFQIVLYEIYEVVLTANNPGANPYLNGPAVSVTFTGTSGAALGKSVTIKGFWDGGATYRVRFAPTATGDWSWTSSSSDIGLNGKSGVLTCSGTLPSGHASARGHVHESVMFPYTFVHDDGTPFFLMGDTQWLFSSSDVSWPTEFQTYVEARAAQGFNYVHGQVYAMNPPGVEKNEGGPVFYSNHVDNLNPGFFQILDQRVAYMNSRGIVAGLLLAWADEGWQQFSTPAQVDRYIQYLINRYAAYNVIWITAGEYEEAEPPGGHNHIGEFLKANDPYDHPITTHTINTSADDFGNAAWHTTIYEQTSNPAQITSDRRYHKPVINAEFGYEGRQSADEVRQDVWEIVMRGGFFVYGNAATYHYNASMTPENLYSAGATYMKILKNFWTNNGRYTIEWWKFTRFDSLGKSRWLAGNPGVAYVVYVDNPDPFTIDLSDALGQIRGQWFDTRQGRWSTTFSDSASSAVPVTPPGSGFAAYVTVGTDTVPPVITSVGSTNITSSSATIIWATNEASDSQVEYGLTTSYGMFASMDTMLVTSHSVALAQLTPDTTYHYRVLSKDAAGNQAVSADYTFRTLARTVSGLVGTFTWQSDPNAGANSFDEAVITIVVTELNATQLQVRATADLLYGVGDDDYMVNPYVRLDNTKQYIYLGRIGGQTVNPAGGKTVPYSTTLTFSKPAAGGAWYLGYENYFDGSHIPETNRGAEESGPLRGGGDRPDTTAPVISSVTATNLASTSAMITWITDEAADSQVEYGLTTSYGMFASMDTMLVTSHSVMLAQLTPDTTYHYRVLSKDAAGNQAVSADFTFRTLPRTVSGLIGTFTWQSDPNAGANSFDEAVITIVVTEHNATQLQVRATADLLYGVGDDDYMVNPYVRLDNTKQYIYLGRVCGQTVNLAGGKTVPYSTTLTFGKPAAGGTWYLGYENYFDGTHVPETNRGAEESGPLRNSSLASGKPAAECQSVLRPEELIPSEIALYNYPNPFNAFTRICFELPQPADIQLSIFDLTGREVRELMTGPFAAGCHEVMWNGRNREGIELNTGFCIVRLRYRMNQSRTWAQIVRRVMMVK